jgi:hypothetical protein
MWTDGKTEDVWLGFPLLQDWLSLCSYWEQTLGSWETSHTRFISSWVLLWARTLGLQP